MKTVPYDSLGQTPLDPPPYYTWNLKCSSVSGCNHDRKSQPTNDATVKRALLELGMCGARPICPARVAYPCGRFASECRYRNGSEIPVCPDALWRRYTQLR